MFCTGFRVCSVRFTPKPFLFFRDFLRFLRFLHKCRSENFTEIYKPAHHRGCASPFGSRHTNPGRAEQGLTGLMVSALFITIYVGLGAQPVELVLGRVKTTAQKWLVCGLVTWPGDSSWFSMTVYARLIERHQNMMNTITFIWSLFCTTYSTLT